MTVFQAIESGEACERYLPTIAALAGGSATSAEVVEIRPHLRHCSACRATVRQLHLSAGTTVKLLLPGFLLGPIASILGSAGGAAVPHTDNAIDEDDLAVLLEIPERSRGIRPGWLRDELLALLHRTNSSDAAAGVYIATSSGGGRISTIATIIGFCVSGAGAGALCVATGIVEAPRWILDHEARPHAPGPARTAARKHAPSRLSAAARTTEVTATFTPTPILRPVRVSAPRKSTHPPASTDPSQGTTPTSHENAPISRAASASTSEFGFESAGSSSTSSPPASAPPTGGGEVTP